jgi:hypothetical protein
MIDQIAYGSHFPVLYACLLKTSGKVLELGCGRYSTALTSLFAMHREIHIYEMDWKWFEKCLHFFGWFWEFNRNITWKHLKTWDDIVFNDYYDVAFVDQGSHKGRCDCVRKLKDHAKYVILHDTEKPEFSKAFDGYTYIWQFSKYLPFTTVGSMTDNLGWLANSVNEYHRFLE